MTIKYKLGFTIDSEVMFMLLSKFLPIQDLERRGSGGACA